MTIPMHIAGLGSANPAYCYAQPDLRDALCSMLLGDDWAERPDAAEVQRIERVFAASRVEHRRMALEVVSYYQEERTTGQRMADYERLAHPLARAALLAGLDAAGCCPGDLTDIFVVSCTGYSAPGLDILLARDLGLRSDTRRTVIGHMGCYGALVGLRAALAALRAHPGAVVALVSVELCSLHSQRTLEIQGLTAAALFADAAAALVLTTGDEARGPELVDVACWADFASADQMSWRITDHGFAMGLSRRVPVTLRRNVAGAVARLLAPHGLAPGDISHWLVHPGGPDILTAIHAALGLCDGQLALSWQVLRERGNCSSASVLLILEQLLRARRARPGEWGVMMAFGPGLTLESCLLRF
ncbi:MAG TPA: 3-oxoacyl-[acyl-carrier-protein] synthase III C-terminal domain-containing protein [Thermomicrobiaceae bacterium]|nr:3-oxoacyl-[acyl-carrier-protein] synthase III C-terminal domain-containing protein [Thermomicrobiaceae bacterium]